MNRWLLCAALMCAAGCKDDAPRPEAETRGQTQDQTRGQTAEPTTAAGEGTAPVETRRPAAAAALSAEHTAALAGVEQLDAIARAMRDLMDVVPESNLPDGKTREQLWGEGVAALGFDPREAANWTKMGVDPAAGLTVAADDRFWPADEAPRPLVLAKITDRKLLVEALRARGVALEVGLPGTDGVAEVNGGGQRALIGEKKGWTAALLLPPEASFEAARAPFANWLAEAGDLAESPSPALRMPAGPRLFAASFSGPLTAALPVPDDIEPMMGFYAARFPAFSVSLGADLGTGQLRSVADPAAVTALRQVLVPDGDSPPLSRFVGPEHVALGFTLDLKNLFDGAAALLPPERGDLRGRVLIAQNALPVALGVSQPDLAAAFTGHFAVLSQAKAFGGGGPSLVLAGLGETAVADRVVPALLQKLVAQSGGTVQPTKFGERAGHVVDVGGVPWFVTRADTVLLAGPERSAIEAALARTAAAPGAAVVDGAGFFGYVVPVDALDAFAQANGDAEMAAGMKAVWQKMFGDRLSTVMRIDDEGIVSDGPAAAMTIGVLAAVAVPAFVKYTQRAKSSQAKITTRQIYQMAMMRQLEDKLPDSAPLTPADDPCAAGGGSYVATATTWSHPTWVGLGFAPIGEQYYRYAFERTADGFVVRAVGDLDCDGVQSTFEMKAVAGEDGMMVGTPSEIEPLE